MEQGSGHFGELIMGCCGGGRGLGRIFAEFFNNNNDEDKFLKILIILFVIFWAVMGIVVFILPVIGSK